MRNFAVRGAVLAVTFFAGTRGEAVARAETIDGRVRLGFESALIEHRAMTTTITAIPDAPSGQEISIANTAVGLGSFGLVFGYGLSDHAMLGARTHVIHRGRSENGQETGSSIGADVYATLAYVAQPSTVRPFIGPLLGVQYVEGERLSSSYAEYMVLLGVQAGAHAFVSSSFSIDPSVTMSYATGAGNAPYSTSGEDSHYNYDSSGFIIGVQLALSGWLGGKGEAPAEPDPDYRAPEPFPPADAPASPAPAPPQSPPPQSPPANAPSEAVPPQ